MAGPFSTSSITWKSSAAAKPVRAMFAWPQCGLMRYVAGQAPETLALTSQVRHPLKRCDRRLVQPLSAPEVAAILAATDPRLPAGQRDHLLFSLLYQHRGSVSEALKLRSQRHSLGAANLVCFHGKDAKNDQSHS